MTLEKKLACLRKREGLSQAEVSEKLDVSRQAVTKWETGTSRPSIENLQSLSRLYNVPLEYLLDESGDDLIADAELYFLLVILAAQVYGRKGTLEEGIEKSVRQLPERIPGANQKIQKALSIMLYAWCAAFLRDRADALMENLEKE